MRRTDYGMISGVILVQKRVQSDARLNCYLLRDGDYTWIEVAVTIRALTDETAGLQLSAAASACRFPQASVTKTN